MVKSEKNRKPDYGNPEVLHDIIRGAELNDLAEVESALLEDLYCINKKHHIHGSTALHIAGAEGFVQLARFLLSQQHLNVEIVDNSGRTAAEIALQCGHSKIYDLILKKAHPQLYSDTGTEPKV